MSSMVRLAVYGLLLSMLGWVGAAWSGEKEKKEKSNGLIIKGELKADDPIDKVLNEPAKVYPLKVGKGDGLLVFMKGQNWDPELRVVDAQDKELARNDDLEGLNPGAGFVAPAAGEIKIIAGSHDGSVGPFTLNVVVVKNGPASLAKQENLQAGDNQDPVLMQPAKVYTMKLTKGKRYVVDLLASDWDCELRVVGPGNKEVARNDDYMGTTDWSHVEFEAAEDGDYQIVAGSHGGETGRFFLAAREAK
jgi:hypothetical protein